MRDMRKTENSSWYCVAFIRRNDMNCQKCGSENVSTERRTDGMRTCNDCGYKWRNVSQAGHIVTSCHEERTHKKCLCCVCGEIHKCTPSFDFYTTEDHGEGLVCEKCFHEYLGHRLNAEKWVADLNA
jgi:uncharacterized Zn ribbon protein